MSYPLENLYIFFTACFAHYCAMLVAALIWFVVSGGRKNAVLCIFVIGFLCTLAFHTVLRVYSSRYMLIPVLLALPIIAYAVIALKDRCVSRCRFGRWIFIALAVVFAFFSFLKFNRSGRNPRDAMVRNASRILREDFKKSGAGETQLISNGDNAGIVFIYAGIPGNFYQFDLSADAPTRGDKQVELLCSQHPLVYVLKEYRRAKHDRGKRQIGDKALGGVPRLPHSYKTERIDNDLIDPRGRYGKFELFRIESQCAATDNRVRIDDFAAAQMQTLVNGDFSRWQESSLAIDPHFDNSFLAKHPRQMLPVGWSIDFNNRRGFDFANWSFVDGAAESGTGHPRWCFHAPQGGFAIRDQQKIPVGGDVRLKVAAEMTAGCKILAFLYVYRKNGAYSTTQPIGVYRCGKPGDRLLSFPIRNRDLPPDGAFFSVGLIGWNGDFSLKKIDIVYDADNE